MNDEFALDPAIASRVSELRVLLSKFGFYEGRFISQFPRGWVKLALNSIPDQVSRQKVLELLKRDKDAVFMKSNRPYLEAMNWTDNTVEQHAIAPFKGILSTEARPGFTLIDDVDSTSFPSARDARVTGSLDNIMSAIRPLIKASGSLFLIDPYFQPWAARTRELLIAVLEERKPGTELKAMVSAKDWPQVEYANGKIRDALPQTFLRDWRFKVLVCDDELSKSRLHSRYLFSEKGGVRLDKGLQTDEAVVDLSFIDKSVHDDL